MRTTSDLHPMHYLRNAAERALAVADPHPKRRGWFWHGYGGRTDKNRACIELSYWSERSGITNLMAFRRRGMNGAEPVFYSQGFALDTEGLLVYERPYRDDVARINHPIADWIAAADPSTVLSLLDEIDRLHTYIETRPAAYVIEGVDAEAFMSAWRNREGAA